MKNVELVPVVKPRTLQFGVVYAEAERMNEMQRRAGNGTGACDTAGVLRNPRLHQHKMQL